MSARQTELGWGTLAKLIRNNRLAVENKTVIAVTEFETVRHNYSSPIRFSTPGIPAGRACGHDAVVSPDAKVMSDESRYYANLKKRGFGS